MDASRNALEQSQHTARVIALSCGLTIALVACSDTSTRPNADHAANTLGPDQERVEIFTGVTYRFNHVHFTAPDIPTTAAWWQRFLGVTTAPGLSYYNFNLDDINMFFEAIGEKADYHSTDDHVWYHIAFAVSNLDAWLQRAMEQQIEIVAPPAAVNGFKSFFLRGPDGVLVELVQASASKELCLTAQGM